MYLRLLLSPTEEAGTTINEPDDKKSYFTNSTDSNHSDSTPSLKIAESSEDKDNKEAEESPTIQKFSAAKIIKHKSPTSVQSIKRLTNMKSLHPIAKGSYGIVYRGIDSQGRMVAVKSIPFSENGIECLLESSIMSTIVHPYINRAHSIILSNTSMNIVQTLADSDLHSYCRKEKIAKAELKRILWQIAQAVYCLHNENIIHGDLKAQNILKVGNTIKLCDFTLAVKHNPGDTYNVYTGTPTHRPPEVWMHKKWSISSDIWSLACTFYEIARGKLLFPIQNQTSDIKKVNLDCIFDFCKNTGQEVRYKTYDTSYISHRPFIETGDLKDLLAKMLKLDPAQRLTIKEVLAHPYFKDQPKTIDYVVKRNTSVITSENDLAYATSFYKNYNAERCTIETALNIYKAVGVIEEFSVDLILLACLLISSKLNFHQNFKTNPNQRLYEAEREICKKLEFKLHCSTN